jgi:tousled-like kinase
MFIYTCIPCNFVVGSLQEEETILRERDRYELEKGRLIREMKRIRDEDGSRFNNFQILNHRYALLNLLGKGGFSEVYKVRTSASQFI